jgi:hypothetical protein
VTTRSTFRAQWRRVRIRSSEIKFAWGPLGGGPPSQIGAIELVIAAGRAEKARFWIDDLRIADETFYGAPVVHASSFVAGREPERGVDGRRDTSWRADPKDAAPWLVLDFGPRTRVRRRDPRLGEPRRARKFRTSDIERRLDVGDDLRERGGASAQRTYLHLPGTVSRFLRFELFEHGGDDPLGIVDVAIEPYEFGRSSNDFFHAVAEREPLGHYPRYLRRQQTYWTCVGLPDGDTCAIMNEDGMVEVDRGTFSIEPFLFADGRLWTWADAEPFSSSSADTCRFPRRAGKSTGSSSRHRRSPGASPTATSFICATA